MVNDNTLVKVRNLVDHTVVYRIDEKNRRVVFGPYETKQIPAEELRILNFTTGGAVLIRDFLNIGNQELRQEFGLDPDQIEYDWTQADVDRVLTTGSMEELEDALDFAPEGIVDMIKSRAVALRIPDMNKRNAIYKKTGADINMQIQYAEKADQNKDKTAETHPTQRRVKKTV